MVKKVKKRKMKLPVHSNQAEPVTNRGEVKKPFIIAAIALGAIVILALLLFFYTQPLAGKATFMATVDEGKAGFFMEDNTVNVGETLELQVRTNIAEGETVAVGFELNLGDLELADTCENSVINSLGWDPTFMEITCEGNIITFKHATINFNGAKSGQFEIAKIAVKATSSGDYDLQFNSFEILDLIPPHENLVVAEEIITLSAQAVACTKIGQECSEDGLADDGTPLVCSDSFEGNTCLTQECSDAVDNLFGSLADACKVDGD